MRAPHPAYSPDIAPSDFYLFWYIKEKLKGGKFGSLDELLFNVNSILEEIDLSTLENVFSHWEERLEKVIESNGNYYQ